MANRRENVEVVQSVTAAMKSEDDCFGRKAMTNLDSVLESRHINSANKGPYSQGYGLPSGHVRL